VKWGKLSEEIGRADLMTMLMFKANSDLETALSHLAHHNHPNETAMSRSMNIQFRLQSSLGI
jgi:hypothetical protein